MRCSRHAMPTFTSGEVGKDCRSCRLGLAANIRSTCGYAKEVIFQHLAKQLESAYQLPPLPSLGSPVWHYSNLCERVICSSCGVASEEAIIRKLLFTADAAFPAWWREHTARAPAAASALLTRRLHYLWPCIWYIINQHQSPRVTLQ